MPYKIIITDTTSALGRALEHDLAREQCRLFSPAADELQWDNATAVANYLAMVKPQVVVNTLGWDDQPSLEQQLLLPIVAANIALACMALDIPLIHFSSYKVFGTDNKSSHSEKDIPAPISATGQAFFAAEQAIEHSSAKAIVLRLGWVIDSYGNNQLTRLLHNIRAQQPISLNSRFRGAPTLLSDVARVAVALIKQIVCGADNWGVMHYCSGDALSEAEFGEQLVQLLAQHQLFDQDASFTLLDQAQTDEPISAVLGCRRIRDSFGIQARAWRPSLLPLVRLWLHHHPRI